MAKSIKSYEKKYTALEELVQKLDDDSLSMHELLDTYKKGLTLVKECSDLLNVVEEEVQQIIETVQVDMK
ncbi:MULTISPECIES: exodeoxyribonuclease VII small subunit [unclassified Veillonella]|uniref:exodeoxyribonuclease VII small subunit n=1 Tax=unclassified Veillonella TaxID=2630086 RepID=UPI000F8D8AFB|nr:MULTISPECIES: exodeoxyribonuclease VII small subunit [unclassified Veillonella]